MIELSTFRLRADVSVEDFLDANADFQQRFIYQQEGLLRRTLATGRDGEWLAITWWRSMADARRSTAAASSSPIAIAFDDLVAPSSLTTDYFKELPG